MCYNMQEATFNIDLCYCQLCINHCIVQGACEVEDHTEDMEIKRNNLCFGISLMSIPYNGVWQDVLHTIVYETFWVNQIAKELDEHFDLLLHLEFCEYRSILNLSMKIGDTLFNLMLKLMHNVYIW